MATEICELCEKPLDAGQDAYICRDCRKQIYSENAKRINLNRLGLIAQGKNVKEAE